LAEELGVASEHISVEKTLHCQVVGTRAYAVLSATLTIGLKKGESIIRPGILKRATAQAQYLLAKREAVSRSL